MSGPSRPPAEFDQYVEGYDHALRLGISVSGESREFFARRRIECLARRLREQGEKPRLVIEYGCGTGFSVPLLRKILGAEFVIGLDVSNASLEVAREQQDRTRSLFITPDSYAPNEEADLVVSNGVFHHIEAGDRAAALDFVSRSLRPGGLFCLWENNPWNPGTRYVMSRIPFDRDASPLPAVEARRILRNGRLEVLRTDHLFLFPRFLRWLRPLERLASGLPLGAQYQVLSRKPSRSGGAENSR